MEHDPMKCRGDNGGKSCNDDPCWSCIRWAFDSLDELKEYHVKIAQSQITPKEFVRMFHDVICPLNKIGEYDWER